ncbi:DNA-directed RNA polymerase [Candidatus Woesearchaeota archaeon]|nr:DNA-directed RNA polymerase [Candidatus Woesearchaeota archaeon]RLE43307.1 MAG: DNA-directed RNA polymerase [Candidatus Woesearchaeota archaeon]
MRRNNKNSRKDFGSGRFRSNYGVGRFNSGHKQMHKAICADCGCECEVPFKPTEGRPVYCKSCYAKHRHEGL